jgi:hypothetical protein
MILITSIHIIDTEMNITRKERERGHKKYRVHSFSDNIGITICATATVTTNLLEFSQAD